MITQPFSDEVALRIALAARVLPDVSAGDLIEALQETIGEELTAENLGQITVTKLKTSFGQTYQLDGDEDGEDANRSDIYAFKEAVRYLWGEVTEPETAPVLEAANTGEGEHSVRVAIASNRGEALDGHFGSCKNYLVYQVTADQLRLIDSRSAAGADETDDRNAYRVSLIRDCHIVYVVSVGGPAAAKVVQAGIYPIKVESGGPAREILAQLQQAIATSPPPWLAKVLGIAANDRVKNYKAAEPIAASAVEPIVGTA
jgi:nitrogen fixation protein NifX